MKFLNKYKLRLILLLTILVSSCSDDNTTAPVSDPFVVAFENLSANLSSIGTTFSVPMVYSTQASQTGQIEIALTTTNAVYGEDFSTSPEVINGKITIDINSNTNTNSFDFIKLNGAINETSEIVFTITNVVYPDAVIQGNSSFTLNSEAFLGGGFAPEVGGPNQQNQVYIDLSTDQQNPIQRDSWDLGFYGGSDFRVGINGSIYMAAAALESTNIDEVNEAMVQDLQAQVAVGTFDPSNEAFIDHPDGAITKTAIAPVSESPEENKVYLINLGYKVGTETPTPGSVAIAGEERGWKKVRILREGDSYKLQYANLNDTNHQEVVLSKNAAYNFTFFSFETNSVVSVEPKADNWDINFTVFTNILPDAGSYGFSDGVLHNRKGGVRAYAVSTENIPYDSFSLNNVDSNNFNADQRTIGSSWREVISDDKVLVDTIYYIIQDPNGNIYKLKFTALLNEAGERGYPEFKYNLLQ